MTPHRMFLLFKPQRCRARLTLAALNRAGFHRRLRPGDIFCSDRGIEYASYAFRNRLAALWLVQHMNRPREITDNAHMESFFHSMKSDALHGVRFAQEPELRTLLRRYIPYYNGVRLHSGIGYSAPSTMRRTRRDPTLCLPNRGKIPENSHSLAAAGHRQR